MILLCREDGTAVGIARTRDAVRAIAGDNARQRELLEERLARQARLRRESREMLDELTGGRYGISMIEFMLTLGTDARFAVRGRISTVKGKSHVYKRIAPAEDVLSTPPDAALPPVQEAEPSPVSEREPDTQSVRTPCAAPLAHGNAVFDFSAADNDDPEPPDLMLELDDIAGAESDVSAEELAELHALLTADEN